MVNHLMQQLRSSFPRMNVKSGLAGMTKESGEFSLVVARAQERTQEQSRQVFTPLYSLLRIYQLKSHQSIQVHSPPTAGGRVDITESQNQRKVWSGRILKDHLIPHSCHGQEELPLDQVAPKPSLAQNTPKDGSTTSPVIYLCLWYPHQPFCSPLMHFLAILAEFCFNS